MTETRYNTGVVNLKNVCRGDVISIPRHFTRKDKFLMQEHSNSAPYLPPKLPSLPGIYIIKNSNNHNFYVGSSVNIRSRWIDHRAKLRRGAHHNPVLQNAWNKYGADAFDCQVLELTEAAEIFAAEQRWLDHLDAASRSDCYNLAAKADSPAAGAKRKPEAAAKRLATIRANGGHSDATKAAAAETLRNYNHSLRGKPKSEEHKKNIGRARSGIAHTLEARERMRQTHLNKHGGRPIEQFTIEGELVRRYASTREAARVLGLAPSTITHCLTGRTKLTAGCQWRYADVAS